MHWHKATISSHGIVERQVVAVAVRGSHAEMHTFLRVVWKGG